MSASKKHMALYNANLKDRTEIVRDFVVRQDIFQRLFEDICHATMQYPEQDYLIVGQRGMGKTTLLHRLAIAIEDEPALRSWLMPVVLNEEQYNITELANLWETVADKLEERDEKAFAGLFDKMEEQVERSDYESFCYGLLTDRLAKANCKIILFLDNFGDFLNKLSDLEARRLREILMTNNQIRLIGASTVMLEPQFSYEKPFWEFFHIIQLEGLSQEETQNLLLRMADNKEKRELVEVILRDAPARIEVLRRLTGGVLRTIILLFEIFIENETGHALNDLEAVLDHVSPLFKHRMDDLSTQQQKIVDAVARNWDAVSVKEIAARTRLESKAVSAQLKQLTDNRMVERITTSNKNHLYQIRERFFNIWYLMRYGKRKDQTRVIWLVKFLESWCDAQDLENRLEQHRYNLLSGNLSVEQTLFMTEVYASMTNKLSWEKRKYLLEVARERLPKEKIKGVSYPEEAILKNVKSLVEEKKFAEAIATLLTIKEESAAFYDELASIYVLEKDIPKAKQNFLKGAEFENGYGLLWLSHVFLSRQWISIEESMSYINQFIAARAKKGAGNWEYWVRSYCEFIMNTYKAEADAFFKEVYEQRKNAGLTCEYSYYLAERNQLDASIELAREVVKDELFVKEQEYSIHDLLILLLAKKQTQAVYRMFEESQLDLKEQFKPLWYALMHLMQDQFPDEYRRMGGELKETVEEIVKKISALRGKG